MYICVCVHVCVQLYTPQQPLWNNLLYHFKREGLLVEGNLHSLVQSNVQLQKPKKLYGDRNELAGLPMYNLVPSAGMRRASSNPLPSPFSPDLFLF